MPYARALAVVALLASAAPAAGQTVRAPLPPPRPTAAQPVPILVCELQPRPFGPGAARVTNIGAAPIPAGRSIIVSYSQAGASGMVVPLSSPLPPGGSQAVPLSGASLLARGCDAAVQ